MNNIFHNKYLKYKMKYLNLKNNLSDKSGGFNMDKLSEYTGTKISGPVSCTRYKISDGEYVKDIYLFGDQHIMQKNFCDEEFIEIQDYLDELFRNNKSKLIDFFIETDKEESEFDTDFDEKAHYINKVKNKFKDCILDESLNTCPYNKIRFHKVDIRNNSIDIPYLKEVNNNLFLLHEKLPEATDIYPSDIDQVKENLKQTDKFFYDTLPQIYNFCKNIIYPIIDSGNEFLYSKYAELFDTNNIVSKEILKSGRYSNNIIEFSKKEINEIIISDLSPPFINLFEENRNDLNDEDKFKILIGINYNNILLAIADFMQMIISISSVIMDSYVLSRMLKEKFSIEESSDKYKSNEKKYGPEYIYIKNIIVYAGESHCQNYIKFLDKMGFKKTVIKSGPTWEELNNFIANNCIELNSPLFS